MQKIGFIGIGIMGKSMAKKLLDAGYPLMAYDINKDAMEEIVAYGAEKGSSCQEVSSLYDVIITMLPNSPHVKKAVLAK